MEFLFQDENLLIINKPAGLLTISDGYNKSLPNVKSFLEESFGRCWIVHRLDKETSGVLIIALNDITHRHLNQQFEKRNVQKKYHAIVMGVPKEDQFNINSSLRVNGDRKHRTIVDEHKGKPAQSQVTILKQYSEYALLLVSPKTGYTHQIRAHLSSFGYPILADPLYSKAQNPFPQIINRTALHAYEITFHHPITNQCLQITAPYPDDFNSLVQFLNEKTG